MFNHKHLISLSIGSYIFPPVCLYIKSIKGYKSEFICSIIAGHPGGYPSSFYICPSHGDIEESDSPHNPETGRRPQPICCICHPYTPSLVPEVQDAWEAQVPYRLRWTYSHWKFHFLSDSRLRRSRRSSGPLGTGTLSGSFFFSMVLISSWTLSSFSICVS